MSRRREKGRKQHWPSCASWSSWLVSCADYQRICNKYLKSYVRVFEFLCSRFHVSTSLNVYISDLEAETSPFYILKSLALKRKRQVWWCPVVPSFWTPYFNSFLVYMQVRFSLQLKTDFKWVAFLYCFFLSEVYYFHCEERDSLAHGL